MKKAVLVSIVGVVLYILLGAIAPFVVQPKISPDTAASFQVANFFGHEPGSERVMLVSDNANPFGTMDYLSHKEEILETGVTILEYDGGTSYHGKCFAVDDRLSGIGSFNWDMRSTYLNTEMMLIVDSEELNTALRTYMEDFESHSLTVADADHSIAPPGHTAQEMPFLQKLVLGFLRVFAGWARFLM